jgi:hypothetical protein
MNEPIIYLHKDARANISTNSMIFRVEKDARTYAKCRGMWYARHHIAIKATINGVFMGYMLQLK